MSIASEITRIQGNIADAYTACSDKEATMPATQNSDNLPDCIASIKRGFYCTLYVYAPDGTVITVDGKTGTAEDGYAVFEIYGEGEYQVVGVYQGHTRTTTAYVTDASYTSASLVFSTVITVYTQFGTVVTCDGTTITATGSYVQFTVWDTGEYTITGTFDGHTNSTSVIVSSLSNTYTANLYMYSNLEVASDNGVVVTVNGESKTIVDESVSFTIWQSGTVTVTAEKDGATKTRNVSITLGTDTSILISFTSISEVDYIQGDGGYINTGFLPAMGDTYTFEVARITAVTSDGKVPVWGSNFTAMNNLDTTNKGVGFGTFHNDRQIGIRRGTTRFWNSTGNAGNWAQQGFVTFVLSIGSTGSSTPTITKDGVNIQVWAEGENTGYSPDSTVPIGIFCSIYNGSAVCISNGVYRFRSFKVTRGGNVVADFRAAVNENDEVGLYDRVSDRFIAGVGNISYQP